MIIKEIRKFNIFNKKPASHGIKGSRSGFVILFAVTISAILLSIALGVASIAQKEIRFGTSTKDSNNAFFAADTGAECALFNDKSTVNSFPQSGAPATITCSGQSIALTQNGPIWDFIVTGLGTNNQSCAKVNVTKTFAPDSTLIVSKGYNLDEGSCNSTNLNRVEREIKISF